jgi:hypothetical protein
MLFVVYALMLSVTFTSLMQRGVILSVVAPLNGLLSSTRRMFLKSTPGLLEVNPQRMWTFEKFFSEVTKILSKKKLHIFYMTK